MLVATDVLLLPSSSVVVMSEALLSDSDWENVEPQSFSFSRKRQAVCVENEEGMNFDGMSVKAPPASRRKIMPPTPQQQSSIEAMQLLMEVEDQESGSCEMQRTARDRTVIAKMEQYLNENDNRIEIEKLESLLGPEGSEVDLRQILRCVRVGKNCGTVFENFSSKGQSELLAASRVRWDELQRLLVTQEEESRRKAQESDYEVHQNWTAAYQTMARRMLSYLMKVML